ncbi:cysteine-rich KTR domain-containing protein [Pumilibacter intestinalis]|jgi:phage FluMu protein Com|uniref:cysteine-rich KTR domain-containing protein n=1 Tax=Pumilibacter intestinalis TaxID=2941511 RepID=UPI00203F0783|nr:cysteine-rich KTR domain-containing protein [Pumilibacter intestinalis]
MTNYVVCRDCGYKLLKADNGSTIEIYCPKCKGKMLIAVKDGKVIVQKSPDNK